MLVDLGGLYSVTDPIVVSPSSISGRLDAFVYNGKHCCNSMQEMVSKSWTKCLVAVILESCKTIKHRCAFWKALLCRAKMVGTIQSVLPFIESLRYPFYLDVPYILHDGYTEAQGRSYRHITSLYLAIDFSEICSCGLHIGSEETAKLFQNTSQQIWWQFSTLLASIPCNSIPRYKNMDPTFVAAILVMGMLEITWNIVPW